MTSKKLRKLREMFNEGKLSESDYKMWLTVYKEGGTNGK